MNPCFCLCDNAVWTTLTGHRDKITTMVTSNSFSGWRPSRTHPAPNGACFLLFEYLHLLNGASRRGRSIVTGRRATGLAATLQYHALPAMQFLWIWSPLPTPSAAYRLLTTIRSWSVRVHILLVCTSGCQHVRSASCTLNAPALSLGGRQRA